MQHAPGTPLEDDPRPHHRLVTTCVLQLQGGRRPIPQTPVFTCRRAAGPLPRPACRAATRATRSSPCTATSWDKEPYVNDSTRIGRNNFSFWEGARMGHGPTNHFDALLRNGAGGKFRINGDYLFRDQVGIGLDNGLWGILRVVNP